MEKSCRTFILCFIFGLCLLQLVYYQHLVDIVGSLVHIIRSDWDNNRYPPVNYENDPTNTNLKDKRADLYYRIHALLMENGSQPVLRDEEIQLTKKYWELLRWFKNLPNQTSGLSSRVPVPYNFDEQNLWGSPGGGEKYLAQLVWRFQLVLGNYWHKYANVSEANSSLGAYVNTLGRPSKRILISDANKWEDWTHRAEWISNARIFGCNSKSLPELFADLEPTCELVQSPPSSGNWSEIDLIVSYSYHNSLEKENPPNNIPWFTYIMECPYVVSLQVNRRKQFVNSYWSGSIVQDKYAKWLYYDPSQRTKKQSIDYSVGKSKMVAMLVSNCKYSYNDRVEYARKLQQFIDVDIYGKCGDFRCPDFETCFAIIRQYKFYLAFENSNCQDYVTEKLHRNALGIDVLPIVMGAQPSYYRLHAPQNSYIHVQDFESPEALAGYLHVLASNRTMYNDYFQWKGTGEFIGKEGADWLCNSCAMLYYGELKLTRSPNKTRKQVVQWLPNFKVDGQRLCLPKGQWYW